MAKTILLTGANGFIGSHLLERLLNEDHTVIIIIRFDSDLWRIKHLLEHENIIVYRLYEDNVFQIFFENNIDVIYHLATFYKKDDSYDYIDDMIEANLTLPSKLLQLAVHHNVEKFITTSTYFKNPFDDSKGPLNLYATHKIAFESILKYYTDNYFIKGCVINLFNVFGPKDNDKIIPLIIKNTLQGKPLKFSNPLQRLSFTYIDDVVDVLVNTHTDSFLRYHNRCVQNLSLFTIRDVVNKIEKILNTNINCIFENQRIANTTRLYKSGFTVYNHKSNLIESLTKTIEYYKKELMNG